MEEEEISKSSEKEAVFELDRKGKRRDLLRKLMYFLFGSGITVFLCIMCLPCNNCHTVVTIHLSILSLICFINSGIPVSSEILGIINKV
jgi:hypothetical protein